MGVDNNMSVWYPIIMKIMVDLDRTVFDCPSITYYFGNMSFGETNLDNELRYVVVDREKSSKYMNLLFFLKMSHAKNFTPVDKVVEVLDKWYKQGIDVTFVSSRANYKSFHKATVEWFESHGIKYTDIIFDCNNKALYGKLNHFDMIVDDTLKNCMDCRKVGITPIWVRTKYNANITDFPKDMLHTSSWEMIDSIVQARCQEQGDILTPVVASTPIATSNRAIYTETPIVTTKPANVVAHNNGTLDIGLDEM